MSAFVVGHDHIDALLTFATNKNRLGTLRCFFAGESLEISEPNATQIGRVLLAENERSVIFRYGLLAAEVPPVGSYHFRRWPRTDMERLSALAILKGCDCFDYQACETDTYKQSFAAAIINAIRSRAISSLPGYGAEPGWEFSRPAKRSHKRSTLPAEEKYGQSQP